MFHVSYCSTTRCSNVRCPLIGGHLIPWLSGNSKSSCESKYSLSEIDMYSAVTSWLSEDILFLSTFEPNAVSTHWPPCVNKSFTWGWKVVIFSLSFHLSLWAGTLMWRIALLPQPLLFLWISIIFINSTCGNQPLLCFLLTVSYGWPLGAPPFWLLHP